EGRALAEQLAGRTVRLATPRGGAAPWDLVWQGDTALLIGGETQPPGADLPSAERVTIPMEAGTESLNAAIAAAVLLFTAHQQRIMQSRPSPLPGGEG